MAKEIVELPVEQLKLGVYVSRLDRPWEDTPFLFQGFAVENDEELQTLRRLCKVVFVEVSLAEAEELKSAARKTPVPSRTPQPSNPLEELSTNPAALVDHVPVKDPVALKTELTLARSAPSSITCVVAADSMCRIFRPSSALWSTACFVIVMRWAGSPG